MIYGVQEDTTTRSQRPDLPATADRSGNVQRNQLSHLLGSLRILFLMILGLAVVQPGCKTPDPSLNSESPRYINAVDIETVMEGIKNKCIRLSERTEKSSPGGVRIIAVDGKQPYCFAVDQDNVSPYSGDKSHQSVIKITTAASPYKEDPNSEFFSATQDEDGRSIFFKCTVKPDGLFTISTTNGHFRDGSADIRYRYTGRGTAPYRLGGPYTKAQIANSADYLKDRAQQLANEALRKQSGALLISY